MALFSDAFSLVVKEFRESQKLSKAALAAKAGLHQTYIGLLEIGERSPSVDTAKAIADAFGVPFSTLIVLAEKRLKKIDSKVTKEMRQRELRKPGNEGFDDRGQ